MGETIAATGSFCDESTGVEAFGSLGDDLCRPSLTVAMTVGEPFAHARVGLNANENVLTVASVAVGLRLSATGYFGEFSPQVTYAVPTRLSPVPVNVTAFAELGASPAHGTEYARTCGVPAVASFIHKAQFGANVTGS